MAELNPAVSVITLNMSGLNTAINRQRLSNYLKKKIQLYAVYRRQFQFKETSKLKVKMVEKDKLYKQ